MMSNSTTSLPPGFRFHPTDEELILYYLRNRATSIPCPVSIIAEVDIYKFDPWDLPAMAMFGDSEWYFFSPRDRKYPNGNRPNRAAASGYWKATGTDKPIQSSSGNKNIGLKKALVFYQGRPPKGLKTSWIMHEYRLAEPQSNSNTYRPKNLRDSSMRLDDWVLCRIYKRISHLSSAATLTDQELEDSGSDHVYVSKTVPNITTMQPEDRSIGLQKSSSLNEFLDLLFDNPSEVLETDQHGGHGQLISYNDSFKGNFINGGKENNSSLYEQMSHEVADENSLKRTRREETNEECSGSSKRRLMVKTPYQQIESSQFGLLTRPFLNQQILLNSNLGLH